jgi:hypothetical protein
MTRQDETGLLGWAGLTGCSPLLTGLVSGGRAANQKREAFR